MSFFRELKTSVKIIGSLLMGLLIVMLFISPVNTILFLLIFFLGILALGCYYAITIEAINFAISDITEDLEIKKKLNKILIGLAVLHVIFGLIIGFTNDTDNWDNALLYLFGAPPMFSLSLALLLGFLRVIFSSIYALSNFLVINLGNIAALIGIIIFTISLIFCLFNGTSGGGGSVWRSIGH
ncbi:MAG: hypothetical protein CMP63_06160 [Flavobacteriales bacterium]|nr:hypothetical protein [Flavobacteriales bacterium]|tara:strand:- start:816 stop:1364 length:549 start_codon:yes stop_codon:yes gene_type:complete